MALSGIDVAVVLVYLVAVVAIGLSAGRGERDTADYFLAGRALPWYLIGFSFFASNMSGASFVGLMGAAYSHGMVVFNYEWTATLVLIFFALFMLPVFLRAGLFTVPAYLEARFDRRSRWAYAGFTILTLMFLDTAGALYAGGVVISTAWPEVDLWQTSAAPALLAAIMSSLDSALNAASSLLTMDFVKPLRPATSERALLAIGRGFTALLIVLAALYAPLIERFGSLFQYFQSTLAYLVPPVVAVYLAGLFWSRATAAGAFWGLAGGLALGLALFLLQEVSGLWAALGWPRVHFTYMALVVFGLTLAILTAVSLAGPAPAARPEALFRWSDLKPEAGARPKAWFNDYRIQAAALAGLMAGFIAAFW